MGNDSSSFPYLNAKVRITGQVSLRTGMHIGGTDVGLAIGGPDNVVVRDPRSGAPYIPGSSLKGKMRSLLEKAGFAEGFAPRRDGDDFKAEPCQCGQLRCNVCQLFGVAASNRSGYRPGEYWKGAGRLLLRDGELTNTKELDGWRYLDLPYTEVKTEVAIDRLTSKANPRQFERVPAGAQFAMELILNVFEGDSELAYLQHIFIGLELLSVDYLGGHGTRGYGAVQIEVTNVSRLSIVELRNGLSSGQPSWEPMSVDGISLPWIRPGAAANAPSEQAMSVQ